MRLDFYNQAAQFLIKEQKKTEEVVKFLISHQFYMLNFIKSKKFIA